MSDIKYSYDQINFHKTFAPQDSYLTAVIELASQDFVGTKEEISEITGIPTGKTSGKVVPHILYAQYMGLTSHTLANSKYSLSLTELGKLVLENDKYLFEDISRFICHYNMTDSDNGALLWAFIYDGISILPGESVAEETVKRKCSDLFQVKTDISPIKRAYSDDGFFASLDLLDFQDGLTLQSHYYIDNFLYAYAYTLLKTWEKKYPNTQEITSDHISQAMRWNKRIGFDEDETLYALEQMEERNLISLNKQLIPYTVIKRADSAYVLPHIYDLLN